MEGQILDFSVQKNKGVINGSDGNRYTFEGVEWKSEDHPFLGSSVDFDIKENNAVDVYLMTKKKSKAAVTLWGIFLGGFGAHKFYMGSYGWGLVYLFTFWLWIPFCIAMVEWIRYVCMTDVEFERKARNFKVKGPFGFFW